MDRDDLSEPAGRGRRSAVQDDRQDRPARDRQAARLEQFASRRAAQPRDLAPGHEGSARNEICADQMVSGALTREKLTRGYSVRVVPPSCCGFTCTVLMLTNSRMP